MAADLTACSSTGAAVVVADLVMKELRDQAATARTAESPGGATVTAAERDAMESHARTRLQGLFHDLAGRIDATTPALQRCRNNAGIGLRQAGERAKVMVDRALAPPAPPQRPGPLAPAGIIYDI